MIKRGSRLLEARSYLWTDFLGCERVQVLEELPQIARVGRLHDLSFYVVSLNLKCAPNVSVARTVRATRCIV